MREKILSVVKIAITDLNEELDYESLENVTEETPIFGGSDSIDSLSLVSLVVGLESEIKKVFGKKILLADEKAVSSRNSPYRTVGNLVDFIAQQLKVNNV